MNFGTPPTLLPLIQQGKIRALAVTTDARYRDMPDVPTMTESGLPQLALTFSAGVLAPAGTPEPILDTLNAAFREALKSPELIGEHGEARLRAGAMVAAAICRIPRRRDEEVAADREGVRRARRSERCARLTLAIAFVVAAGFGAAPAQAQQYPDKPIKLIIPLVAGSPITALARVVAQPLSARLGQQVDHREPARRRHTIGVKAAAAMPPDGYTPSDVRAEHRLSAATLSRSRLRSDQGVRAGGARWRNISTSWSSRRRCRPRRCRNSSPMRRPTRASSISASGSAPCRRSSASISIKVAGLDIVSIPYAAASRCASTSSAAAST